MEPQNENLNAPLAQQPAPQNFFERNKSLLAIGLFVLILLVISGVYFLRAQPLTTKQFSDPELGISFSYPKNWGGVKKETTSWEKEIKDGNYVYVNSSFDLIHSISFTNNSSVVLKVNALAEPDLFMTGYGEYETAAEVRDNPREQICKSYLRRDRSTGKGTDSSLTSIYGYGVCTDDQIAFVEAEKRSDTKINLTKIYVIKLENPYYPFLEIQVVLPALDSTKDDRCSHCMSKDDKTRSELAFDNFETDELNLKIKNLLSTLKINVVSQTEASQTLENYFKEKTSYTNKELGISFDYPKILPAPQYDPNTQRLQIEDYPVLELSTRADVEAAERRVMDYDGGPPIIIEMTPQEYDMQKQLFETAEIGPVNNCKDYCEVVKIGNNKFLMVFNEGHPPYGQTSKKYIAYKNNLRYEFNSFFSQTITTANLKDFEAAEKKSLMTKVLKDMLISLNFQ